MAAKKSKKTTKTSKGSDSVIVQLDADTVLTLHAAVEALSEFASAVIMASDDPALRGVAKRTMGKKSPKKRAQKSA